MTKPLVDQPVSFSEALGVLGLSELPDRDALKKAYRRETLQHPPDVDPEGFQRVRAAYELLQNPLAMARDAFTSLVPRVPPPRLRAAAPMERGALSVLLLRASIGRVSARALLDEG